MYGTFDPSSLASLGPRGRSLVFGKGHFGLHSMVASAGYDRPGGAYDWQGLKRGKTEWALFQYTLSGQGRLSFEGRPFTLLPGQALILHFPHDNRYYLPSGGGWEFFYLCLNGSELLRIWRWAISHLGPVLTLGGDSPLLAAAAGLAQRVLAGEVKDACEASAGAYEVGMKLLAMSMPTRHLRRPARPPAVAKAIEFCRQNLALPLDVADLARAGGLSRTYFTRLFQASEGMGPGEFVGRERMRRALRLLQTTAEPIKTIALQCGFVDVSYFCKVFRRAYDVTPATFRRSGMY